MHVLLCLVACWAIYIILLSIYRITLHPLARFPGPTLAKISYCYEFWFDVIRQGRYTREIGKLHTLYDELHCNDPSFINEIYASGNRKRNKSHHYVASFPASIRKVKLPGFPYRTPATDKYSQHAGGRWHGRSWPSSTPPVRGEQVLLSSPGPRARRVDPGKCPKALQQALACRGQGPIEAAAAFNCFTTDTLTEYCFGESTGFLDQGTWEPNYNGPLNAFFSLVHVLRHLSWLTYLLDWAPLWIVKLVSVKIWQLLHQMKFLLQGRNTKKNRIQSMKESFDGNAPLLNSKLPAQEKTIERLSGEAHALLVGGTGSTTSALCALTYQLLANPRVLAKLSAELATVVSDPASLPSWVTLERLPYFNAVMTEGLCLMYGSSQRLPRVATEKDLVYNGFWKPSPTSCSTAVNYVIPRGYAVGMSGYLIHSDEIIFPKPSEFRPERWLDDQGQRHMRLDQYHFSFAKGGRQCVAMQLAYAEFYICLEVLIVWVFPSLQLYQTKPSDVEYDHDEVIGKPKRGSKGVRLLVIDT